MNIIVNECALEIAQNSSVEQLLMMLNKPLHGTAIAVNQTIISRCQWPDFYFSEGDQISLFQAIAGG